MKTRFRFGLRMLMLLLTLGAALLITALFVWEVHRRQRIELLEIQINEMSTLPDFLVQPELEERRKELESLRRR